MEGESSVAEAPSVLPIDRKTVHQICSGQVVLNLATAIKELLENSLDAGATSVDIKLKENGAELVEVSDNGSGVEPLNFEALTLKHHTSKLRDFSDLSSVETFGFRGEALSSLCALSNLTITTRHKSQEVASKLVYDHNGKLVSQTPCARQQGTTVTLGNLFSTLPVRHKEFLHNIKKELVKLVHVLHGYCIISNGVRIVCTNQIEKGRKNTVVSTLGSDLIRDNITCVFGPKQIQSLIPFKQTKPSEEECSEYNIKIQDDECKMFQITGFISKADHGMGRSAADRQFFFINKRPCDLLKISRVVNEVYHMYNRHQYPFVMLDISLGRDAVDVNVTPDKRKVFMQEEKLLVATVKCSLKALFDPGTTNYEVNQKPLNQLSFLAITNQGRNSEVTLKEKAKKQDIPSKVFPSLSNFKRSYSDMTGKEERMTQPKAKQPKLINFFDPDKDRSPSDARSRKETRGGQNLATIVIGYDDEGIKADDVESVDPEESKEWSADANSSESELSGKLSSIIETQVEDVEYKSKLNNSKMKEKLPGNTEKIEKVDIMEYKKTDCAKSISSKTHENENRNDKKDLLTIIKQRKRMRVNFSLKTLKPSSTVPQNDEKHHQSRLFCAKISPESNATAEEELTRNIKKESFSQMRILGQFNLGFILTRLDNDLFIIDQHAADEKYSFEYLQRNTVLQTQRLIVPRKLELTAVNESILIDNIEIFRKNGFEFEINDSAQTTQKVHLISVPVSKNWTFGVEDVEEMIFMLSDSPGVMCRPTRVRKMFASRACRGSTMVGTALTREEMKTIVNHMGQMDHPWNCPHGRPTMRHLVNLNMIPGGHANDL